MLESYDAALLAEPVGTVTKVAETATTAAASTGLFSSLSSLLGPVGAGLGLASSVGGMFGTDGSAPNYARAGGDYYSGSFSVNKIDTGSIIGLVVVTVFAVILLRGKK